MPANGAGPSRAEALAAAIDRARAALEQHLRDHSEAAVRDGTIASEHVLHAHRELIAACELMALRHSTTQIQVSQADAARAVAPRVGAGAVGEAPRGDTPAPEAGADALDDLTRIRGLDAPSATRLASIGIHSFAQIAAWQPEDVPTIAQALDLGRDFVRHDVIEQAKMLLVARSASLIHASSADARSTSSVATWLPHTCELSSQIETSRPQLSPEDFEALRRELRRGVGRHQLRSLAEIAPTFTTAIMVSEIYFDPFESEAGWRPLPLVVLPTRPADDDNALSVTASSVEPRGTVDAQAHPRQAIVLSVEQSTKVAGPASPLHVAAGDRLDKLEAEIAALGEAHVIAPEQPPVPVPVAMPANLLSASNDAREQAVTTTIERAAREVVPTVQSEEADVTITVHQGKPSRVGVMPELTLQPKRFVQPNKTTKPVPNSDVSEAAVVIVKRRAAERAAPDLEFYKVPGSTSEPGPVKRLLRAVKVL